MRIVYNGFVFDDNVIKVIEDKCAKVNAHKFNKYLHESRFGGKSVIEVLKAIKGKKKFVEIDPTERFLDLSIPQQKALVINFYKSLSLELGEQAASILNNRNTKYCVNITMDTTKECSGNVSTRNGSNQIHYDVNLDGTIRGIRILSHELGHAMSGLKTNAYEILNNGTKDDLDDYFHHLSAYPVDSITEIESHIVEFLFMNFLLEQKIITNEDYQKYEDKHNNSLLNNINTVLEESMILDEIEPPITPEKFQQFEKKIGGIIKTKKYKTLMNRFIFMFKRDTHSGYSQYDFRYIVGEVISSNWSEKYSMATYQEKLKMKRSFIEYLSKSHEMNLQSACLHLLDSGIGKTVNEYLKNTELNV